MQCVHDEQNGHGALGVPPPSQSFPDQPTGGSFCPGWGATSSLTPPVDAQKVLADAPHATTYRTFIEYPMLPSAILDSLL